MYRRVDCDLVMDAFVQLEALKELNLSPSAPYQRTGVALALRPGLDGVDALRRPAEGGAPRRPGRLRRPVPAGQARPEGVPFGFEDDMLAAVAKGEVDAAAVTPASAGWYLHQHPGGLLRLVDPTSGEPESVLGPGGRHAAGGPRDAARGRPGRAGAAGRRHGGAHLRRLRRRAPRASCVR